jgi:hypothetical protein
MKKILYLSIVLILFSCKSIVRLNGKTFELSDSEELIKIHFLSSDICEIQQSFYCENLPDSIKKKTIKAKYQITNAKLPYIEDNKTKIINVKFLKISNLDSLSKQLPKYTYIKDYSKLCQNLLTENSKETKLKNKISSGIILNLINDSLIIKKDTIIFGYKKVPIKN